MTVSAVGSTEHWYSSRTARDYKEDTYCQEDHADDNDQNQHKTECAFAGASLILVCRGELFRGACSVDCD